MIPRTMILGCALGTLSIVTLQTGNLPPQQLPIYGGGGGTAFTRSCGAGKVLSGLRFREGLVVDAVGLLCRPVNSNGTLGSETSVGTLAGGGGGTSGSVSCSAGKVVTKVSIYHGGVVDGIWIVCGRWDAATRKFGEPHQVTQEIAGRTTGKKNAAACEAPTQPMKGIRGRAAGLVDAIGFTCDEP